MKNSNLATISIGTGSVREADGLYCLNDLHKLSGGEKTHQPSNFMRTDQTIDLINEIDKSSDMRSLAVKTLQGRNGGTYVCKELVYSYAMWVSAAFNLTVIRAFDAIQNDKSGFSDAVISAMKQKAMCEASNIVVPAFNLAMSELQNKLLMVDGMTEREQLDLIERTNMAELTPITQSKAVLLSTALVCVSEVSNEALSNSKLGIR